jgi:branched-chain amino acid aminotransferase
MEKEELLVYLNGRMVPKSEAKISVFDHGLLYGDGIFEGIRAYNGYVFLLKEHIDRLYESADFIELKIPLSKQELTSALLDTLRKNSLRDAYIRLVVTRGIGDLGVNPVLCKDATVFIITEPVVVTARTEPKEFAAVITSVRRDAVDATTHECKSLNYLNSILAVIEANRLGADVAVMLDSRGFVSEGPTMNLFVVKKGMLYTPGTSSGILHGITRERVMRLAREMEIQVVEKDVTAFELLVADEAFLTGTLSELVGITSVNKKPIGDGTAGPMTRKLYREFNKLARAGEEGTPIYEAEKLRA